MRSARFAARGWGRKLGAGARRHEAAVHLGRACTASRRHAVSAVRALCALTALLGVFGVFGCAESDVPPGDWRVTGNDAGNTRYSALDQINRDNVAQLRVAWTYRSGDRPDDART